eukprot:7354968-Lingulodinium_polyedra.AAC.1
MLPRWPRPSASNSPNSSGHANGAAGTTNGQRQRCKTNARRPQPKPNSAPSPVLRPRPGVQTPSNSPHRAN